MAGQLGLRDPFDAIPKVELHCHVEGSVRPQTVAELAARAGRPLPAYRLEDLYRYDSLDSFLSIFWLVQETLVNTDDPAMMSWDLGQEYRAVGEAYRLDIAELTALAVAGIESTWLDDGERRASAPNSRPRRTRTRPAWRSPRAWPP